MNRTLLLKKIKFLKQQLTQLDLQKHIFKQAPKKTK